jgi:hypothetical protein
MSNRKYARNTLAGPLVLSSDPKGTTVVTWMGKGDPNGEDVQAIPDDILNGVAYDKIRRRGIIEEMTEEEAYGAMETQNEVWEKSQSTADIEATIERTTNNDFVVLNCIGPSTRGQGLCGADVNVRDAKKNEAPPLCAAHVALAREYVPEDLVKDGRTVKTWTRFVMAPRQRVQD